MQAEGYSAQFERNLRNDQPAAESQPRTKSQPRTESQVARGVSKTPLINREHVRSLLLELAKQRAHRWNSISEQTLVTINEMVRAWCVRHLAHFPSKGKRL